MLLIEPDSTDAAFHFAAEEFCMDRFETAFLLWRTERCAMLGRNQIAEAEIDRDAAERFGVRVVRRSSGGGTIYTDPGTLLYTMIVPYDGREDVRRIERTLLAEPMVDVLKRLGVPAEIQGRNDLLAEGKKFSGLAQRVHRNRLCSHGSLLFDADLSILEHVLKTDDEKIRSKAVASIRNRVNNLRQYRPNETIREFLTALKQEFFRDRPYREHRFTSEEVREIDEIRKKKYGNPEWNFGAAPPFTFRNKKRFPAGGIEVFLDVRKGIVVSCGIRGDFLGVRDVGTVERLLENKTFDRKTVEESLRDIDLAPFLGGITAAQLIELLFDSTGVQDARQNGGISF